MMRPTIQVNLVSTFRLGHGLTLRITPDKIVLMQEGPRGGEGPKVELLADQWDAIDEAVRQVRTAIARANVAIEGVIGGEEKEDEQTQQETSQALP